MPLPNRHYTALGKLLFKLKPDVAQELSSQLVKAEPLETDLSKIPMFFQRFCQVQGIEAEDYTGPLYRADKIDQRKLFVSLIRQLYGPDTRGLIKQLTLTLHVHHPAVVRMFQRDWYYIYDDFCEKVDRLVKQLKGGDDASA